MNPLIPLDSNMQLLSKVLDLRAKKAQVISANIANAETPGYSTVKFEFENELKQAINKNSNDGNLRLKTSSNNHIGHSAGNFNNVTGKIHIVEDSTGIGDENGVSVDQEMLELSENELLYETAAQLLKKKMSLLKYVVSGGQ